MKGYSIIALSININFHAGQQTVQLSWGAWKSPKFGFVSGFKCFGEGAEFLKKNNKEYVFNKLTFPFIRQINETNISLPSELLY